MKSASQVVEKWAMRAAGASQDYLSGAEQTTKDQSSAAIAAIPVMKAALDAAFARGAVAKGLQRSGKAGWLAGVREKGASNYGTGVSSQTAQQKYVTNSGRYDSARNAASGIPRQARGSAANHARSQTVGQALNAVRTKG